MTRTYEQDVERQTAARKITQKTDNSDVEKATTHECLSSSNPKEERNGFILAAQNQSIPTRLYQSKILKNGGLTPNIGYFQITKRL